MKKKGIPSERSIMVTVVMKYGRFKEMPIEEVPRFILKKLAQLLSIMLALLLIAIIIGLVQQ